MAWGLGSNPDETRRGGESSVGQMDVSFSRLRSAAWLRIVSLLTEHGLIRFLEKKFGRFAIQNVTLVIIVMQVMAFAAINAKPKILDRLILIPAKVLEGEIYRLLTFVAIPFNQSLIWAFFAWYIFYLMGAALEQYWGAFRYNMFLLIGLVATVAVSFVTPAAPATNGFLYGTVFLAFAFLNPDFEFRIFFVLPVKVKWLAWLSWFGYLYSFAFGDWGTRLAVAASVLNFFIFFWRDIVYRIRGGQRSMSRAVTKARTKPKAFYHKCAVCGLTDTDDREMDFRYCSQCSGDQAYCSEHLKDHEHIREDA